MSAEINEALFEMHFHKVMLDCFQTVFGAQFLRILKPTPQKEVWVGFDQGWVRTSLTNEEFYDQLGKTIRNGQISMDNFYIGYFLQFKCVDEMQRISKFCPPNYYAPYYRAELSTWTNWQTGLSQHETLLRLSSIRSAQVYYACPMIFDYSAIYEPADLDQLRCIDILTAPPLWSDDERHFIMFQQPDDSNPLWCSKQEPSKVITFKEFASRIDLEGPRRMRGKEVLGFIDATVHAVADLAQKNETGTQKWLKTHPMRLIPESLTMIEFKPQETCK